MNDEDLGRLLRDLPPAEPSFDFTARVLSKLQARSEGGRRNGATALVFVGAALLVLFASQGYVREWYERSRTATRVRELRDEYRELQTELEKLRVLTRELEPVLNLGGTEDVEFVFDLRELAREDSNRPRAEPASHAPSRVEERRP
jgi:hypothetical protein